MRHDMKDVIIDTGRQGWEGTRNREKSKLKNQLSNDDLEEIEVRKRAPKSDHKDRNFGDRTSPLFRWIEKQVGRPWDEVYSEICKQADSRTIRGYHLRQHVEGWISTNPSEPYSKYSSFIVVDGILQRNYISRKNSHKKEPNPNIRNIDESTELRRIDGVWYKLILAPIKEANKNNDRVDAVTKKILYCNWGQGVIDERPYSALYPTGRRTGKAWSQPLYARSKEQLNKKQLKEYDLKK